MKNKLLAVSVWLSVFASILVITLLSFEFVDRWYSDKPEINNMNNRIVIRFRNDNRVPIYVEQDGIIGCLYMPDEKEDESL